jgi:hypothetical protein
VLLPLSVYLPLGPSLAPQVLDTYARPGLYLADAGVLALILTMLVPFREDDRRWGWPWFTVPLLALVGWGVLTVPTALSPALAAYTALRWLAAAAVYVAVWRRCGASTLWACPESGRSSPRRQGRRSSR